MFFKLINNTCRCIIYFPLICAQIVSFTRQIRRKPLRLQLKRANPRWISLLPSSLEIPSDHSVYKKLQTTVSSWVLLSYSHDTLATPVTSLHKQLHTHTSYCCGRVCVYTDQKVGATGRLKWSMRKVKVSPLAFRNSPVAECTLFLTANSAVDAC